MATHPVDGEVADADVPSRLEQPVGVLQHVPPVWDHGDRVGDANNVAGARGRKTLQVGVGGVAKNDVDLGGGCKGGEGTETEGQRGKGESASSGLAVRLASQLRAMGRCSPCRPSCCPRPSSWRP